MPKIEIRLDRCKGCTLCVGVCPKNCIEMSNTFNKVGYHYAKFVKEKECTGCGFCYQICPDVCIDVYK
ncbi:MAG: 4Fe-4S binding protein [Elusimicrobia bacterium]|nr:4Fe-4S binding protein [Elusimicrobiota bacterium]